MVPLSFIVKTSSKRLGWIEFQLSKALLPVCNAHGVSEADFRPAMRRPHGLSLRPHGLSLRPHCLASGHKRNSPHSRGCERARKAGRAAVRDFPHQPGPRRGLRHCGGPGRCRRWFRKVRSSRTSHGGFVVRADRGRTRSVLHDCAERLRSIIGGPLPSYEVFHGAHAVLTMQELVTDATAEATRAAMVQAAKLDATAMVQVSPSRCTPPSAPAPLCRKPMPIHMQSITLSFGIVGLTARCVTPHPPQTRVCSVSRTMLSATARRCVCAKSLPKTIYYHAAGLEGAI
jgi:hypothetical protein